MLTTVDKKKSYTVSLALRMRDLLFPLPLGAIPKSLRSIFGAVQIPSMACYFVVLRYSPPVEHDLRCWQHFASTSTPPLCIRLHHCLLWTTIHPMPSHDENHTHEYAFLRKKEVYIRIL